MHVCECGLLCSALPGLPFKRQSASYTPPPQPAHPRERSGHPDQPATRLPEDRQRCGAATVGASLAAGGSPRMSCLCVGWCRRLVRCFATILIGALLLLGVTFCRSSASAAQEGGQSFTPSLQRQEQERAANQVVATPEGNRVRRAVMCGLQGRSVAAASFKLALLGPFSQPRSRSNYARRGPASSRGCWQRPTPPTHCGQPTVARGTAKALTYLSASLPRCRPYIAPHCRPRS